LTKQQLQTEVGYTRFWMTVIIIYGQNPSYENIEQSHQISKSWCLLHFVNVRNVYNRFYASTKMTWLM